MRWNGRLDLGYGPDRILGTRPLNKVLYFIPKVGYRCLFLGTMKSFEGLPK